MKNMSYMRYDKPLPENGSGIFSSNPGMWKNSKEICGFFKVR